MHTPWDGNEPDPLELQLQAGVARNGPLWGFDRGMIQYEFLFSIITWAAEVRIGWGQGAMV